MSTSARGRWLAAYAAVLSLAMCGAAQASPGRLEPLGGPRIGIGSESVDPTAVVHRGSTYVALVETAGGRSLLAVYRYAAADDAWLRVGAPLNADVSADVGAPALLSTAQGELLVAWTEDTRRGPMLMMARLDTYPNGEQEWQPAFHGQPVRAGGHDEIRMVEAQDDIWVALINGGHQQLVRLHMSQLERVALAAPALADQGPYSLEDIVGNDGRLYALYRHRRTVHPQVGGAPSAEERMVSELLVVELAPGGGAARVVGSGPFVAGRRAARFAGGVAGAPILVWMTTDNRPALAELDAVRNRLLRLATLDPAPPGDVVVAARLRDGIAVAVAGRGRLTLFRVRSSAEPSVATEARADNPGFHMQLVADPDGEPLLTGVVPGIFPAARAMILRP